VLDYGRVGKLAGVDPGRDLLLPRGRPLSYLRVNERPHASRGLTRSLLERRATELRVRIPVVVEREGSDRIVAALERFAVSQVFPVLDGTCERDGEVEICWLDLVQVAVLRRSEGTGLARRNAVVVAAGIGFSPTFAVSADPEAATRSWQYWNSEWEFADPPEPRDRWWRVRPNETRRRGHWLLMAGPGSRGPEARGTFAACLHPSMREELGNPPYVVVEHPFRGGRVPVAVLEDEFRGMGENVWGKTIFLDRTARDGLGLLDGEFCLVHPWTRPRIALRRLRLRDRLVGARTIAAHPRAPARADLEKPVCRLEPEALETIGGRAGEFVAIERVVPAADGREGHWDVVRTKQRVLPIDRAERTRRAEWEAPQTWDAASEGPGEGGAGAPELEGYVDCAERLGLHPPYPAIYLNYYTRKEALGELQLCEPVQVRVGIGNRLANEASEFAWLAVIALLGAAIAFLDSPFWQVAAACVLIVLTAAMLAFRAIRAVR
jgi:hypothetical protein